MSDLSNTRIFIAYRGGDEKKGIDGAGKAFAEKLYNAITSDKHHEDLYGKVYFSPAEKDGNYIEDIDSFMLNVEYFILPFSKGFFNDFENNGERKALFSKKSTKCSVTRKEIQAALDINKRYKLTEKKGSKLPIVAGRYVNKPITFIRIDFPGFEMSEDVQDKLKSIFKDDADAVTAIKSRGIVTDSVSENNIIDDLLEDLCRPGSSVKEYISRTYTPNIYLSNRRELENESGIPVSVQLTNARRVSLMNFAATALSRNANMVALSYDRKVNMILSDRFRHRLLSGKIELNVMLSDPSSDAAKDAAKYKMNPEESVMNKDKIIDSRVTEWCKEKVLYPNQKINLRLTEISLPYGIMRVEFDDPNADYIKVDLYAPMIGGNKDKDRPSFYIFKNNPATTKSYEFFSKSFDTVFYDDRNEGYSKMVNIHANVDFLLGDAIVHRGLIDSSSKEHTLDAFRKCTEKGYPIEVDLLQLKDGEFIVYRDSVLGDGRLLSDCTIDELQQMGEIVFQSGERIAKEQIMRFDDFLKEVDNKSTLLIEIKSTDSAEYSFCEKNKKLAHNLTNILHDYNGTYAIHSINPYILHEIKSIDVSIPCGQISLIFDSNHDETIKKVHNEFGFREIVTPDFVSYKLYSIGSFPNEIMNYCAEQKIPMLIWTVRSKNDEEIAKSIIGRHSDGGNIIIERALSYLDI